MNTNRLIRALSIDDIARVQAIDTAAHGRAWSHRTFVDDIEQANRTHLVAEVDGQIVAHAAAWIDHASCRITNVAVGSDYAGAGHASALLIALFDQTLDHHKVCNLQLEVRPANRRAQRLYNRFGFSPVGIERDFYPNSDESGSRDALIMAVADACDAGWRARLDRLAQEHTSQDGEGAAA